MTLEEQVKANSAKLDREMTGLLSAARGKWITYHDGNMFLSDSYNEAFKKGEAEFGNKKGFVVREITDKLPKISKLVKT